VTVSRRRRPTVALAAACAVLATTLGVGPARAAPVSFDASTLHGTSGQMPTTLAWGPDDRLYVGYVDGTIRAYTVVRDGPNDYRVTATQTIAAVRNIPNHDDDGDANPSIDTRLLLGLAPTGTAQHPVLYASSSDPRIGGGSAGTDTGLDTNSGTLSRLTWTGAGWTHEVLVRGLPRSEENHAANGLALAPDGDTLYWAYGGHTNQGGPSPKFAGLPEYAYSGAVLRVDLDAIADPPYDVPTLDDPARANVGGVDAHDPFGGNDGANQARIVAGGPVQVWAPGFRNPYDLVIATVGDRAGTIYLADNGANKTWGAPPAGEGTDACTNALVGDGDTGASDALHRVTPGYYGGHPNPTRGNAANTFHGESPILADDPVQCDLRSSKSAETTSLSLLPSSSDGIAEYTATNFDGALRGDLLLAAYGSSRLVRISLNAAGTAVTARDDDFATFASTAKTLDVTAVGDDGLFPGTIWVAAFGSGTIHVLEPGDFGTGGGGCSGEDDGALDEDDDWYTNADEIDNGTDPCSAASRPPDHDADGTSDLHDPDDDDDGRPDTEDPFAIDPDDGASTTPPVALTWDRGGGSGVAGTGFTGLMTAGGVDYLDRFDARKVTVGGRRGVLRVASVPPGDALGARNSQRFGFQLGVAPDGARRLTASARIVAPFRGTDPAPGSSIGLQVGTGTQSDHVKLVVAGDGGGRVTLVKEVGDAVRLRRRRPLALPGPDTVDLLLTIDVVERTAVARAVWRRDGEVRRRRLGGAIALPASWWEPGGVVAVGVLATSRGPGPPFTARWDHLRVVRGG
jgi:hypothetical protein